MVREAHADWRALGTGVRLVVVDGDLAAARWAVEALLAEVDRTYSRFRPDSELMLLHRDRGRDAHASPLLSRAIEGAVAAARRTGGAVDPTVGRALRVIGYDVDFAAVADGGPVPTFHVAPVPGWSTIGLNAAASTVRIPFDVELDLGSTGKGLAADLAAAAAIAAAGPDAGVLVSLGGDIATAGRTPPGGWRVTVLEDSSVDPRDAPDAEVVAIDGGAIATSSTTVRRWLSGAGVAVHHIVDPRTGGPANNVWRTSTVAAATCEEANAASTAAIVLGTVAPDWLEHAGYPARLVAPDGTILRLGGWPEPGPGPAVDTARTPPSPAPDAAEHARNPAA